MIEHRPWVGKQYGGLDGQRLAIMGYSHWLGDNQVDSNDETTRDINKYVLLDGGISFYTIIRNRFGFADPREFWPQVAFFNFLPECVSEAQKFDSGSPAQIERARARLDRILQEHKPNKLLVFSARAWKQMRPTLEEEEMGRSPKLTAELPEFQRGTYEVDGHRVEVFGLRHPQGASAERLDLAVAHIRARPLLG